jgi:hypothetical protein
VGSQQGLSSMKLVSQHVSSYLTTFSTLHELYVAPNRRIVVNDEFCRTTNDNVRIYFEILPQYFDDEMEHNQENSQL